MQKDSKRLNIYNLDCIEDIELTKENNVPIIRATHSVPEKIISFNHALLPETDRNSFIHFFIDDYQFDRVWRNPERYVSILLKYKDFNPFNNSSCFKLLYPFI